MFSAIILVWDSLIMSFVPQTTSVGIVSFASSKGEMFGSFTIRPSISAFFFALGDFAAKRHAILYPISMGNCAVRFTPEGSRLPPFRISAFTISGCCIANFIAMFAPSEKPRIIARAMPSPCMKS